jgi:hypothetical protein
VKNYQFSALELSADLDIDDVAEVFVRINSAGIDLNSADFILTLMSVHVKEARHELEGLRPTGQDPVDQGGVALQPLPRTVARSAPPRCRRSRVEAGRAPERVPGTAGP